MDTGPGQYPLVYASLFRKYIIGLTYPFKILLFGLNMTTDRAPITKTIEFDGVPVREIISRIARYDEWLKEEGPIVVILDAMMKAANSTLSLHSLTSITGLTERNVIDHIRPWLNEDNDYIEIVPKGDDVSYRLNQEFREVIENYKAGISVKRVPSRAFGKTVDNDKTPSSIGQYFDIPPSIDIFKQTMRAVEPLAFLPRELAADGRMCIIHSMRHTEKDTMTLTEIMESVYAAPGDANKAARDLEWLTTVKLIEFKSDKEFGITPDFKAYLDAPAVHEFDENSNKLDYANMKAVVMNDLWNSPEVLNFQYRIVGFIYFTEEFAVSKTRIVEAITPLLKYPNTFRVEPPLLELVVKGILHESSPNHYSLTTKFLDYLNKTSPPYYGPFFKGMDNVHANLNILRAPASPYDIFDEKMTIKDIQLTARHWRYIYEYAKATEKMLVGFNLSTAVPMVAGGLIFGALEMSGEELCHFYHWAEENNLF